VAGLDFLCLFFGLVGSQHPLSMEGDHILYPTGGHFRLGLATWTAYVLVPSRDRRDCGVGVAEARFC
jgi:hypothetical protein